MQMNGHRMVPPPDHTSILIGFALRIGRLEGAVFQKGPEPQKDQPVWLHYVVGAFILGSAAAGKVSWQEALPSVLGLFGR